METESKKLFGYCKTCKEIIQDKKSYHDGHDVELRYWNVGLECKECGSNDVIDSNISTVCMGCGDLVFK